MPVFAPAQGSTREDRTASRDMKITVTLDNGQTCKGRVLAMAFPKLQFNNFTGFGPVNSDAATRHGSRRLSVGSSLTSHRVPAVRRHLGWLLRYTGLAGGQPPTRRQIWTATRTAAADSSRMV